MNRITALVLAALIAVPAVNAAPRIGPTRVPVPVGREFPIHRALPLVVVRPGPAVVVAPRLYLAPILFGRVVVRSLPGGQVWEGSQRLEKRDGWTDFTMDIDRRGERLYMNIDRGAANLSFAEVVFDDGQSQVIDFGDREERPGLYSLVDFTGGRKIDHVHIVAKADTKKSDITLRLTA